MVEAEGSWSGQQGPVGIGFCKLYFILSAKGVVRRL